MFRIGMVLQFATAGCMKLYPGSIRSGFEAVLYGRSTKLFLKLKCDWLSDMECCPLSGWSLILIRTH